LKISTVALAAALLVSAGTANAQYYRPYWEHHENPGAAALAGGVVGLLIGAAIAGQRSYPTPRYVGCDIVSDLGGNRLGGTCATGPLYRCDPYVQRVNLGDGRQGVIHRNCFPS
jgi:hypothetical protein